MKGPVTKNTHVQNESLITSSLKVRAKVKAFVHASHADTDSDSMAMILASRTYLSVLAKKNGTMM